MKKPVHISVIANEDESLEVSFYFGNATRTQLSILNHELDILKYEILSRIRETPPDYQVEDYGDGGEEYYDAT